MADPGDRVAQLEARIDQLEQSSRRRRRNLPGRLPRPLIVAGILLAMVLPAGVALAAHQFTDVSASHTFHADIGRLADAGITAGCTPTEFCPDAGLTRGQMAGFLTRGLGRAASDNGVITFTELLAGAPVAELTMKTGGVSGGSGFLLVTASATIQATDAACPCDVGIAVRRGSAEYSPGSVVIARTQVASGWWMGDATVTWVFEVPSGSDQSIELVASGGITWQGGSGDSSSATGMISALYVPFGPSGGSFLGSQGESRTASPGIARP